MRRKLLSVVLCTGLVISLLAGVPIAAKAAAASSVVRVKLSIETTTSLSFFADGNYTVGDTVLARQLYTAKVEGSSVGLYYGSTRIASGTTVYVAQRAATAGYNNFAWLEVGGSARRYLGDLCFSVSGGNLMLVNYIDLDQYLYGVVPYEMSDSWPAEALKAQAVAARNYTVKRLGSGGSYDITDSSSTDQVYKGYDPGATNAIAAVNATAGQVLLYGSTVIDTYYSASNGGWTELPYHRWGGGKDWVYYQITEDPYDVLNPSSRFETIFFPVAIDGAHPITTDNNMDVTIDAGKAVTIICQAILDSGKLSGVSSLSDFTLTGVLDLSTNTYDTSSGQDHSATPGAGVNGGVNLCVDKIMATGDFTVSAGGTAVTVEDVTFDMRKLCSSDGGTAFVHKSLGIYVVEPVTDGGTLTGFALSMRRYGHGCGLSQRGAQQRAKAVSDGGAGQTYAEILDFYYPNTTLTTLDFTRPTLTAVTPAPDYSTATVTATDSLNVRSSPSSSSSTNIVGSLPGGARIEVTDDFYTGDWHQINFGGAAAYVHKDYVTLDSPVVQKHVSGVSLGITTATLAPGDTVTLTAAVLPSTAVNKAVSWTSSNTAAATVSGGVVTAVAEGTANITVKTAEGSYTAVCAVAVKSNGITSVKYRINTDTVTGVTKNTGVAQFIANLGNDAASLHVYKTDGTEVSTGNVATGMTVALMKDGAEADRLTIVVLGDVYSDGVVDILDYTSVRLHILGMKPLSGAYALAADTYADGVVDILDYTAIRLDILGLKTLGS